ncbi:SDR family oxidoreductase [Amycolatopsis rubida]|uniref:Uncharacterized conserved protein YbjT, contains NAD(P)-binding and DUF2867 domains n=1 Tax=Amycolatopsis rubida TaxID=112413 RepID=A0A1I5TNF2_9PSEU|nr:NAD(P)H-binding protein [Amycolatopsis rubida]SFP84565.1 Uncharacterized conserved protein YbjT, contains NAD(P)-binding and DUF2867 domains [Amycolatopsis rubida]
MILVTGATGSVGQHVVARLAAEGHPVRALTRKPDQAVFPQGVEVAGGDLATPASLVPALAGVEAVYLLAMGDSPAELLDTIKQAGVRRVVLLSVGFIDDSSEVQPNAIAATHWAFEQAVRSAGVQWTFLRPDEFAGNALQWAPQIQEGDVVRAPYSQAHTAPIHELDVAEVAARALVDEAHAGASYHLTGPESLTHADQVRLIGETIGRELRFEETPAEQWRERMTQFIPAAIVDSLLNTLAAAVDHPAEVSDVVEKVTGHSARGFAEWARDHAADFR